MKRATVNQASKGEVDQLYRYTVWAKQFLSAGVETAIDDVRPVFLANGLGTTAQRVAGTKLTAEPYVTDPTLIEYDLSEDGSVTLDVKAL